MFRERIHSSLGFVGSVCSGGGGGPPVLAFGERGEGDSHNSLVCPVFGKRNTTRACQGLYDQGFQHLPWQVMLFGGEG
jgi:hypothetical protein